MTTQLECSKCGTVYRGEAIKRLDTTTFRRVFERDEEGVYEPVACLCECDSLGHAQNHGLKKRLGAGYVIVREFSGYSSTEFLGKPIRTKGKTRFVMRFDNGKERVYQLDGGREHGGKSYLDEKELAVALRILGKVSAQ